MADARREPLPRRCIWWQRRRRIHTSPAQAKHREQQYHVADIGMDRAMEETIRPRRDMIHPPAIGQHAEDDDTQNPVKPSRNAAPARRRISNHILLSLSGFCLVLVNASWLAGRTGLSD